MTLLPIPTLEQTLERFINGIAPILTPQQADITKTAADAFQNKGGPLLQQRLQQYAQAQAKLGISWLTELKLAEYLNDTRPHAITNNASLQLDYQTPLTGTARAASFIHRIARLHLDYINDKIEAPVDPRGQPISMYNWRILTGAMREPNSDQSIGDKYYYAPKQAANRNISLFWQGHHFVLPITDGTGKLAAVTQIHSALESIMYSEYDEPTLAFTQLSALGSVKVANYLAKLCQNPANQKAYQAIKDSLFCFAPYHSGSIDSADEISQIQQQTFMPGHAWQLKPNTYQMDLDSDFLTIHFEHSEVDGAALQHMFNYAFGLSANAPDYLKVKDSLATEGNVVAENNSAKLFSATSKLNTQQLDWQCEDTQLVAQIKQDIDTIKAQAEQIKVQRCLADYSQLQAKVSHDGLMQFALIYAQLKVFGYVRNTYEAVDTSHFMAGRTEGLRPNSEQAITLAQAMLKDTANMELLQNALDAHKQRVIACKTGQAFDRHLSGLKFMITKADQSDGNITQFFSSPGYQTLTSGDFLSTSSMGTQSPVKRILFAPVMPGGFGVNYSLDDNNYEFVLFADKNSSPYLDAMCEACVEAVAKMVALTQHF